MTSQYGHKVTKTHTRSVPSALIREELPIKPKLSRHCLATIIVEDQAKLYDSKGFVTAIRAILDNETVQCIGEVTHEFQNRSFSSVLALAESHISVHTWPERFSVQLDVFLCNYMHDNTQKSERIFEAIIAYFGPVSEIERTHVDRL